MPQIGPDKPLCGAKKRQPEPGKEYCTFLAGWGTDHAGIGRCKLHGGNTPQSRRGASKVKAEREAQKVLAQLDVKPVQDPLADLLRLAGQILSWQEATSVLVNRLEDRVRYEGKAGAEQLRAEVALYERVMDCFSQVLGLIVKLNIEERFTRISED
jgi:hypothetical protein